MNSSSILSFWKNNSGKRCTEVDGAFRASLFNLNAARRPARFAPACPQNQRTRFSSANRGPRNPKEGARRSARFAPACPQSQLTRFSSANRRPENPKEGGRRPARFAHACPQSQRTRFSSANPGDAQNSKTDPIRRRSPAGNAGRPAHFSGANRPGIAPVNRRPEVKFKLTIQSENLWLNSKYFYHSKAD